MPAVIHLPARPDQTAYNVARWEELLNDSWVASIEGRIETDRHGQIIKSPPPSQFHGRKQLEIGALLRQLLPQGRAITECPISTEDGVRAADVAWISSERAEQTRQEACLTIAPEICVEVLSPSNSQEEIRDKSQLYFAAGAAEVWWCLRDGTMRFFVGGLDRELGTSQICPEFPARIEA